MKKDISGALGGHDDEMGEVDIFGLDEFGMPVGGDAMWGAVIGGGIGTSTAIIVRKLTEKNEAGAMHKFSELFGMLAGGAAGAVMAVSNPGMRHMGWAAVATAVVTNGLRQVERSLFPTPSQKALDAAKSVGLPATPPTPQQVQAAAAQPAAGWGGVTIDPTGVIKPSFGNGFGIHTIEPGYVVPANLPALTQNGFGEATIEPAFPIPGSISGGGYGGYGFGQPELVGPPTLVGAGDYGMGENPGAQQTKILGGPAVSSMGMHFGATLFGGSGN